jgi:cytokinin riboside 5'-monophosphate phosphoribohydrolase
VRICVYCGSSTELAEVYTDAARELGRAMGERGHSLVYGAGNIGLMGELAAAVKGAGGHVTGVIPRMLVGYGLASQYIDDLIVTETMAERKAIMEAKAQGFIALPGGFGTLEELLQVLTLKQLHYLQAPIVLLNIAGFYDTLLGCFEQLYALRFARPEVRASYAVVDDASKALDYVEGYQEVELPLKWQ